MEPFDKSGFWGPDQAGDSQRGWFFEGSFDKTGGRNWEI
jgi:hypothetical protein